MTIQSDPVPSDRCEKCGRYEKASIEQCFIGDKDCPRVPTLAPTRETAPALSDEQIIAAQLSVPPKNPDGEEWGPDEYDIATARAAIKADREQRPAALSEAVESIYKQALQDIADPVAAAQRDLPAGHSLNGAMLMHMLDKPEHYKAIARTALASQADRERAITGEPVALWPKYAAPGEIVCWHCDGCGLEADGMSACNVCRGYAASITGETSRDVAAEGKP